LEIDRSFGYFKTQVEGASIDRIFLSGGGSLLKGLPEAIRKSFNLPVEQYNLLNTLEVDTGVDRKLLEASLPFLTTAIGVAVEEKPLLNLLPLEKKGRFPSLGENQKKVLAFGALGLLFFGYLGQHYFSASSELRKLEKKVALRQQEIARMEVSKKDLENLKRKQDQLDQQLTAYPPTMIEKMPAQEIMLEIGRRLSPNMTLTSFSLVPALEPVAEKGGEQKAPAGPNSTQPGKPGLGLKAKTKQERQLLLKGIVFGPGDQILKALDDFSRGLEQVSYITQVRLEEIKKNELFGALAAQDFQMIIRLKL
jgi:Tfp pilus assembly protein PilN